MPTREEVLADIDAKITDKTPSDKVQNADDGANRVLIIDYIDQEVGSKEDLTNKSTDVDADGDSNTKYPSVKAVKDYVDANVGSLYTAIVGLLSYDGTIFTYTSIVNQTDATITWGKFSGTITGTTSTAVLTNGKTIVKDQTLSIGGGFIVTGRPSNTTNFTLLCTNTSGTNSTVPNFTDMPIEIFIYN